ncbi:MAG: ATP synthase F1 subunit delta [Terriglobales bacterium]
MASVAIRYARAFADVVISLKLDANQVRDELRSLVEVVSASEELRRVWESPAVSHAEKVRLLDSIAQRAGFSPAVRNFMAVLIEHGRTSALLQIQRQLEHELNERLGYVEADITSARELGEDEKRALETQIARLTGRKVRPRYATCSDVLGGAIVRIGSTIYDGSLRGQLRRMKEQLSAG